MSILFSCSNIKLYNRVSIISFLFFFFTYGAKSQVCNGFIEFKGRDRVTPPQTNFTKYFPSTGFTWECWFSSTYYANTSTTIDARSKLIAATDFPAVAQDIVLGFGWPSVAQKSELCFVVDGPSGTADRDNTPCKYLPAGGFIANKWYHVAGVRDYANNTSKLYVDGVLVDSKTNTHAPLGQNTNIALPNFYFGSFAGLGSTDSAVAGKMDEIRIWNYARSGLEISSNYNKCLSGTETGLVAYYHCNEKSGTTARDATLNANNATLSGGAAFNKNDNALIVNNCLLTSSSNTTITISTGSYWGHSVTGTYTDTLTNVLGCDSLRILNLTVGKTIKRDTITKSVCQGQAFAGYNTSGTYIDTFKLTAVDSIRVLYLAVISIPRDTVSKSICQGQSYLGYSTSGYHSDTFHLVSGCDSIRVLNLFVTSIKRDTITTNVCQGQSYLGYNSSGYYSDTFHLVSGCDSIRVLNLFVSTIKRDTIIASICQGQSYLGYSTSGYHSDTFHLVSGCDSIRVLNLFVSSIKRDTITASICLGQSYLGYTTSGYHSDTFHLVSGCDSIRVLNLTLGSYLTINKTVTICADSSYRGFSTPTIFNDTLSATTGCDTIKITTLKVLSKLQLQLINDTSICQNDTVVLNAPANFKTYLWNNVSTGKLIKVASVGKYWLRATDSLGCAATDTFNLLNVYPIPNNFLPSQKIACKGEAFTLNNFTNYLWNTNETAATIQLNGLSLYWLTAKDNNGCIGTDSMNVTYSALGISPIVITGFSPNGDGINDWFKPFDGSCIVQYSMIIFNRWGQKIYESSNVTKGWDGNYKSKPCPVDVYYYVIGYTDVSGQPQKKNGCISLLR